MQTFHNSFLFIRKLRRICIFKSALLPFQTLQSLLIGIIKYQLNYIIDIFPTLTHPCQKQEVHVVKWTCPENRLTGTTSEYVKDQFTKGNGGRVPITIINPKLDLISLKLNLQLHTASSSFTCTHRILQILSNRTQGHD